MTAASHIQAVDALVSPTLPGLSASVAPPGANGVVSFTGTADAGSIVEIAERTTGGTLELIGQATADAAGAFTFDFPKAALGYGTVTLAARELNTSWQPGAWSTGTQFTFTDPESGLRHVGADLATKLRHDAATGADATADLQALANEVSAGAPAVLNIPAGTYFISSTILLHSGTYMDDPGVTLEAAADWQRPMPGTTAGDLLGYTMVANVDYASTTTDDSNIQIRNVAFNWNGFENYGSAAVRFINAENVLVQNSNFYGNEDGIAFIGDDGAVVNGCTAVGTVNYAYDNWDGPNHTVIENSTAEVARGSGVSITGRGTATTDDATADIDAVINNTVYGNNGPGIEASSLSLASAVDNLFVAGNLIVGPGSGISVTGTGSGAVIAENTISGSMQRALQVSNIGLGNAGTSGLQQQNVIVTGNTIGNATIPAAFNAAVIVQAQGAGVYGNTVQYGSQPYDLWLAGADETSSGNTWDDWKVAAVSTAWATDISLTDRPGSSSSPAKGQAPYTLNNGTLTITGAGTLDLRGRSGITAVQATEDPRETVYLPASGVHLTVTSAPGRGLPGTVGFGAPGLADGLTIYGAAAADTIDLGTGDDAMVLGSTLETVHGGGGADTFYVTATTAGATIDGGSDASQIVVTGGGSVTLGAAITDIRIIKIASAPAPTTLVLNGLPDLTASADDEGDTLIARGSRQTLMSGLGTDTLVGVVGGDTVFAGRAANLQGDIIENFSLGDTIDVTSVGTLEARYAVHLNQVPGMTTVNVLDGSDGLGVNIVGTIDGTRFHLVPDGGLGMDLVFAPGTYTVFANADITDVLGRINKGGVDAATNTGFTMMFGGYLLPGGTLTLTADIQPINLPTGASLTVDGTGHTLNAGAHGGLTVVSGNVTVQNFTIIGSDGAILLTAGTLRLNAAGSFGGGVAIGDGTLMLGRSGAAGTGAITFTGSVATLEIASGVSVTNTIDSFGGANAIVADGITNGSVHYDTVTHHLTISGTGGSEVLDLGGSYFPNRFSAKPDANGTVITYVPCFASGTRILTAHGEVPVAALRIGDLVVTISGDAKPVKWIGHRSYSAAVVAEFSNLRPVIIRKNALAPSVPRRDLLVSPMHALLIDDWLIPAAALVNGVSIVRSAAAAALDYFHVELDRHDVIFAEGVPAESFLDDNSRAMFDNASEYHDVCGIARASADFCATRLEEGHPLEAIHRRLAGRPPQAISPGALVGHVERLQDGVLEGWVMDEANPFAPVELDVLVDGDIVATVLANRYRVDLDRAGIAGGRCGFTVAMVGSSVNISLRRTRTD